MSKKRRLHPIAMFFILITFIRRYLFVMVAGFFAFRGQSLVIFLLAIFGIISLLIIFSFIGWYRFTYRIEEEELRIEHGIFIRKKRYIPKNRIQSIDVTATVLHRIFGLVKVQIETASSGEGAEALLSALKFNVGEQLRDELKVVHYSENSDEFPREGSEHFNKISFSRLFIAGSTSGSIGVLLGIVIFGFSEIEKFIPKQIYEESVAWLIQLSVLFLILLVFFILFILWLLGIAGTMIKYGNFTISKDNDELFITRGLLEKRQLTIPLKRIQAIGIKQSIIRQPFGFVTVFAVVAGGSMDKEEEFPVLFPIMKKGEVDEFLARLLPDYTGLQRDLTPLPKRARKYYLFRSSVLFGLLVLGFSYFLTQFVFIPIVLLLFSLVLGFFRYHDGGFILDKKRLIIQQRILSKITIMMPHNRIQAMTKSEHKVQKMEKLASLKLSLIGSLGTGTHYVLKDLNDEDANLIAKWYSYRE